MSKWHQLTIVHVSDMHFGERHFFNPPAGGSPIGRPTLGESILKDLRSDSFAFPSQFSSGSRVIVALTGDFNERCVEPEFEQARTFLKTFYGASIFGQTVSAEDIFMVPGNHDLKYADNTPDERWVKYVLFYQDHNAQRSQETDHPSEYFDPRRPDKLSRVIDQSESGLIIAEINSSAYVQKNTADERRGQVDDQAVNDLEEQLNEVDPAGLRNSIKVALIHHHPVVLPVLYEADKDYDAVLNSELLFRLLKKCGFHLLLHGHKHNPFTYSYDAVSAWTTDVVQPILVIAGGSAGSTEIPKEQGSRNTYNVISIKWHPGALQGRIHVETRGLVWQHDDGTKLPAPQWRWKTLRTDDRLFLMQGGSTRERGAGGSTRQRTPADAVYDDLRSGEILRLRRNYTAIEVFPSLNPDQGYEALVWIEAQAHDDYRPPDRVEWAASPGYFREVYVCERAVDPKFRARFSYYGPTLIQARLFWSDYEAVSYIYARIPQADNIYARL